MDSIEHTQMGRKHVFVVNGAAEFLDLVRDFLQDEHYNVTTTNFVPHTFDQISALHPDLLIIDLAVGIRAGWNLLEALGQAAATNGIPVIVVSTSRSLLDEVRAAPTRFGGQRLLTKPFDLEDLLRAIDDLIGHA